MKKFIFGLAVLTMLFLLGGMPAWAASGSFWHNSSVVKLDDIGFRLEVQPDSCVQAMNIKVENTDYDRIVPVDDFYVTRAVDIYMVNNQSAVIQLQKPVRLVFSFDDIDFKRASRMNTNLSAGHFRVGYWDESKKDWIQLPSQVFWNGSRGAVEAESLQGGGRYALLWSYSGNTELSPVTSGGIRVMVNSVIVRTLDAPYEKDGRVMIPLRSIAESIGASVEWVDSENRIDLLRKNDKVQLWIGKNNALKNNENLPLDVAPEVINGRTFVPLRFVAEAFGASVEWVDDTQTAEVFEN